MNNYIETIKKFFSCSERIAMVFKDNENVWCNRNHEFFGGRLPKCDDLVKEEMKESNEGIIFKVSFTSDNNNFSGELSDTDENGCRFALLDKKDILSEAFNDDQFQKYIESNDFHLRASVAEISANIDNLKKDNIKTKDEFKKFYDSIERSCKCILKTVQNNKIMKNTSTHYEQSEKKHFSDLPNAIVNISNCLSLMHKPKININTEKRFPFDPIYIEGNIENIRHLITHTFKDIIYSSYSTDIDISLKIPKNNQPAKLTLICQKKKKNTDLIMDIYDKMRNFNMDRLLIERLARSENIPVEKKEFDNKISMSMYFHITKEPHAVEAPKIQRPSQYNPADITFYEFL